MSDDEKVVYEVELDLPGIPTGEPVQIPGLGTFNNGDTLDVTKREAEFYRSYHIHQEPIVDEETQAILGSEAVLGPTLLQAFKDTNGVKVTTVVEKKGSDK